MTKDFNDQEQSIEYDDRLIEMFDAVHQTLTPDFTGNDWNQLFQDWNKGDTHSGEMFISLWKQKVEPSYSEHFIQWCKERDSNP